MTGQDRTDLAGVVEGLTGRCLRHRNGKEVHLGVRGEEAMGSRMFMVRGHPHEDARQLETLRHQPPRFSMGGFDGSRGSKHCESTSINRGVR